MDSRASMALLDDEDESVRIAVKALGDMRNSTFRPEASRNPQPQDNDDDEPASRSTPTEASPSSPAFVTRMSSIPLLKSALTVYEQGKASSRVVKYGAEMVESSVKTLSRPVIDRLPVNVNQLDEFACRQLDRLDRYRRPSNGESSSQRPTIEPPSSPENSRGRGSAVDDSDSQSSLSVTSSVRSRRGYKEGAERSIPSWIETTNSYSARSTTPTQSDTGDPPNDQQVAQRSRWQAVLLEAGGLSAALSEESMRRLKYCLQWLQYATAHIDAQILILREFTSSLQTYPPDAPPHARRPNPISEDHMRKLAEVRKDIVQTVRQVVDVVSKYAGGALPEPARATVRGFILKLPQRWASKAAAAGGASQVPDAVTAAASGAAGRRSGTRRNNVRGVDAPGASGVRSGASSAVTSPTASPRMARATLAPPQPVSHGAAMVAAQRILSLATESLDMMRGVTGVVKDSLDRADMWVTRLRTVGIQRAAQEGEGESAQEEFELPASLERRHRRNSSSQFSDDVPPSPFFSAAGSASTSTAWNSSIPSTPQGTSTPVMHGSSPVVVSGGEGAAGLTLGSMTLVSRCNTPKSAKAELSSVEKMEVDDRAL